MSALYSFVPRSTTLPQSTYSPLSYTPGTSARFAVNEDEAYYYQLIKKALARSNSCKPPSEQIHPGLSSGRLLFSKGVVPTVQLNDVTTALQLSNVYHLLKAMGPNMEGFLESLENDGIPTLVQAIRTGNTPPYDTD